MIVAGELAAAIRALPLIALAACASPVNTGDPNALLDKTEAEVIAVYGRNFLSWEENEGDGKVTRMSYRLQSMQDILMYGNPYAGLFKSDCTLIFTLASGRVIYTTPRGRSCR